MKHTITAFYLWLLVIIMAACGGNNAPPPPPTVDPLLADATPKAVEIGTPDSIALKATYYPSQTNTKNAPALLLVHAQNSSKESWQPFATAAQQAGYATLALDLRGHGESTGRDNDFEAMEEDVDTVLNWLIARPETANQKIGIAGAGLGANLAMRVAAQRPEIKSVVLLSPGLDYNGVTTQQALARYGQRPVIIVATADDYYASQSARTLNSQALGRHQLQIYPGRQQGTAIFQAQAGLQPMLLAWLATTL